MVKFDGQKLNFVYCHADAWFYYRLVISTTTIRFIRLRVKIVHNSPQIKFSILPRVCLAYLYYYCHAIQSNFRVAHNSPQSHLLTVLPNVIRVEHW